MKQKKVLSKIAGALFIGTMALSSCVQGGLYDDFYDEDMPSWMMIARRKFKNENGNNDNNGSGDVDPYDELHPNGPVNPWPDDEDDDTQTDEDNHGSNVDDGWNHDRGHDRDHDRNHITLPAEIENSYRTYAAEYVNTTNNSGIRCNIEYQSYSESSFKSYLSTFREPLPNNQIIFKKAYTNQILIKKSGDNINIEAYKEVSGAVFIDLSSFTCIDDNQTLTIWIEEQPEQSMVVNNNSSTINDGNYVERKWVYKKHEYNSRVLTYHGTKNYTNKGWYMHTHPDGNRDMSPNDNDRKDEYGGLKATKSEIVVVNAANIQQQVNDLEITVIDNIVKKRTKR